MEVSRSWRLVLTKCGWLRELGTARSIRTFSLMNWRWDSSRSLESWLQEPGRVDGTADLASGSQLELAFSWPLNCPSKLFMMSLMRKEQMALPATEFSGVLKTPNMSESSARDLTTWLIAWISSKWKGKKP